MTITAQWEINQYTITFDTAGGSEVAPITQDYGTAIVAPADPAREGYTFMGWDKAIPTTMPAENVTITAKWQVNQYTVTFDTAGGSEIASITQNYGTAITAPADPTREGYTFLGWDKAIPATMPAENVTIKAKWKVNSYTITFDTAGGSEIAPITQDYGTTVTAPEAPTKIGYTFKGWDKEIPATMPAENLTLTAQWMVNRYTISFNTDGGSEVAPITQDYGSAITAPADPTREGYTFTGWDKAIPETMPAENMTITAQWAVNQYTVTFDTAGGSDIAPITQDYGSNITAPADPTREGYTFTGWDKAIPETMPAENMTITAQWTVNQYTITYDLDGGTAEGNPVFYTAESPAITLNAPTKAGYVFTGWSGTDLVGEDNLTVTIPAGSIGDRRYTAHWTFDPAIIAALEPKPNTSFRDVSRSDWFYYDVRYVCENGLMNGTSKNLFSPGSAATRGMLVTILYRLENEPRCFGGVTFPDVAPGAYYEKAVIWASQNSIVSGYTDGTFRPDAPVTREQLASILYRYTRYRGLDVSAGETADLSGYADVRAISDYALPAMRWACGAGILQGSNGKLQPSGLATRSQLAAMLHRYLKN